MDSTIPSPIRTPIKKPLRTPVKAPLRSLVRTPLVGTHPFENKEQQGIDLGIDGISESELAGRIQVKVKQLPPSSEVFEPKTLEGVSALFLESQVEDITEEELDERVNFSVGSDTADPHWNQMTAQLIQSSCAFTAQELLTGPNEAPYFGKFLVGDHHLEWDELIAKHKRICILAARDHGKTYFMDFAYPIWKIITQPRGSGFIFSSTQEQAERILTDIRTEIETNPKLQYLIPKFKDKWGSRHIRCSNGHRIYARGFGTRVRGAHPNWIVVDDSLNDETAYSELVRNKQKDYFYTAITNMIVPSGQIIVIGTPFHAADLYADLKENPEYHFSSYPAETSPGKPGNTALWEDRYDLDYLAKRKAEIGSIRYTREFLCCKPGTYIETIKGAIPIEDIKEGTIVLTHKGNWEKVVKTFSHKFSGNLIKIKGELEVTPNHPIYTQDEWVNANELIPADQVTFPKPKVTGDALVTLDFAGKTKVPYLYTKDKKRIYARGSAKQLPSGSVGRGGKKSIPSQVLIDEDLLYLFGLWIAEGFTSGGKLATFCFGYSELGTLVKRSVEIIKDKFGLEAKVVELKARGSALVQVGNRFISDFFDREFKRGAGNKRVPQWLKNLSPELLWSFILGYIDGDGHVDVDTTARVSSVSPMLLKDIRFLLARCGIFSNMRLARKGGLGCIEGRPVNFRDSWILSITGGGYHAVKSRKLPSRDFNWSRVHTSLGEVPYEGAVYNIEVANDNSYVADGVAVHNCEPVSDEMSLFPLHLFKGTDVEHFNMTLGMPYDFWNEAGVQIYMGVDFAMSTNVEADYTVVWVVGVDGKGNRWLIDMHRAKGLPYQEQLSLINTLGRKYQPALIFLEDNQMQRIFGDELIRTSDLPIKKFTTGVQKNSLDKGVPSLRVLLENGKFRIPRGDASTVQKVDTWIEEMRSITFIDGKIQSVGSHDDTVMALWICDQAIRQGGFQFTFGGESDYADTSKEKQEALFRELTGEDKEDSTPDESEQTINLL